MIHFLVAVVNNANIVNMSSINDKVMISNTGETRLIENTKNLQYILTIGLD